MNHIKVVRDHDPSGRNRILAEVNGVQILDYLAADLDDMTGVGLFSQSMEMPPLMPITPVAPVNPVTDARFDNFAYYPLPPPPVVTPPPGAP